MGFRNLSRRLAGNNGQFDNRTGRRARSARLLHQAVTETLEVRQMLTGVVTPTVSFNASSESVDASAGSFTVGVTLSSAVSPVRSTVNGNLDGAGDEATGTGVAVNPVNGDIYVSDQHKGDIYKVTPGGSSTTFATGLNGPYGMAFDSSGNLYVANSGNGKVDKINAGGTVTQFASLGSSSDAWGMVSDSSGNIYVSEYNDNEIVKINSGGTVTNFASVDYVGALTIDPSSGTIYSGQPGTEGGIDEISSTGAVSSLEGEVALGFQESYGVAFANGTLYASWGGKIYAIDPSTGSFTSVLSSASPMFMAADSSGDIYFGDGFGVTFNGGDLYKLSTSVDVPIILGGTATENTDYSGVNTSIVIPDGDTTGSVTGTLISDSGPSQTLTMTMGTVTGGANAGTTSINTLTILELPSPTITVTPPTSGTYDGDAFTASATVLDSGENAITTPTATFDYYDSTTSTDLGTTAPTDAGDYTVTASFAGDDSYSSATSTAASFTIDKATPSVTNVLIDGNTFVYETYTGSAFSATADVSGVNDASIVSPVPTFDYKNIDTNTDLGSTGPTDPGDYTVTASFAGNTDYTSASFRSTFIVDKYKPSVSVTAPTSGTYSGDPFTATASVTGVSDASIVSPAETFDYYDSTTSTDLGTTAPTDPGDYTVSASFAGNVDYSSANSTSASFTIDQYTPTVSVIAPTSGTYTGDAFTATASVTGVEAFAEAVTPFNTGISPAPTLDYVDTDTDFDLGTTAPTDAGHYSVTASFAGNVDYSSASSSAASFTIDQATPSVSAIAPTSGTYTGSAFTATASVTGVSDASITTPTATFDYINTDTSTDLGSTAPIDAGNYSVMASFAGNLDYTSALSTSATFTIDQATPTVSVIAPTSGTFTGDAFTATASVTGVQTVSLQIARPYDVGITPAPTFDYINTDTSTDLGSTAPIDAGDYSVTASFAGNANYSSGTSTAGTFSIYAATPTVTLTAPTSSVYTGSQFTATATVTGVSDSSVTSPVPTFDYYNLTTSSDLGSTAPSAVGDYQVTASFAGNLDYNSASSITQDFNIFTGVTGMHVADDGGVYNGKAYPATGYVYGYAGTPIATPVFSYYNASDTKELHPLAGAPTAGGSYYFLATFAGNQSYLPSSTTAPFVITPAASAVHVADAGGVYTGKPFTATGYVSGVNGADVASPTFTYYLASDTKHAHPLTGAPTDPGSYYVIAAFAGNNSYQPAQATVAFSVTQAPAHIYVANRGGVYSGKPYPASGYVAGVDGTHIATPVFAYYLATDKHMLHPLPGAPTAVGNYFFLATFAGNADYPALQTTAPFTISEPVSNFKASPIHFKANTAFSGVVAQFSSLMAVPGYFSASINWGDGTTSTGVVTATATAGGFQITGGHTWKKTGSYTVTITLNQVATTSLTAKGLATSVSALVAAAI